MALKKLPIKIQSHLNAAAKIRCFDKAVQELVYNSLDAEATSIAIRIDIHESFIQVVDNGSGIPNSDIPLLGDRYTSSKITDTAAIKKAPKNYGFHGESLANIIETSKRVKITTRYKDQDETWVKCFCNGQHKDSYTTRMRPSKGTTVEVKGFLHNLHIPKESTNELNELEKIKSFLQRVALVKTNISLSIRDNYRNEIIFKIHKNRDFYQTLFSLFEIEEKDLQELQIEKNLYKAKGYIGKQIGESNSYRWMYLNGKFIYKSVLHDIINSHFMIDRQLCYDGKQKQYTHKNKFKKHINLNMIPTYFVFISCPYFDYDINFTSPKTIIEFNNWAQIEELLEKLVKFYKGDIKIIETEEAEPPKKKRKLENTREEVKRIMEKILGTKSKNLMHMCKSVKGKIVKNKLKNKVIHKLGNKINNNLNIQNRETNDNNFAYQKSPSPITNYLPLCKNVQAENVNTPKKKLQIQKRSNNLKKKMKDCKKKNKAKMKPPVISGIEYHVIEETSVKKKNKHKQKNLNNLNNSDITGNPVHNNVLKKHNLKSNNKIKLQKSELDILSRKQEHKELAFNINQNSLIPLRKINYKCLKSSDLVKTILNSQKGSCIDTMYCTNRHVPFEYMGQLTFSDKTLTHVNKVESNVSTTSNTKLTFQSHHYQKDHTFFKYYQNIRRKKDKYITEQSKDNAFFKKNIKKYLKDVTTNNRNKKEDLLKNMEYTKCDDLSEVIEFTNSYRTVNYFKTFNNKDTYNKHPRPDQYKVSASIQNTYTIINSNVSLDFASYSNNIHNKTRNYFQETEVSYHGEVITTNKLNKTDKCNIPLPEMSKNDENNLEVIFISNSQNSRTHPSNEFFEPINFCKAVYKNVSSNNLDMNGDIHEGETNNQNGTIFNKFDEIRVNNEISSQLIDKIENVSHHFLKNDVPDMDINYLSRTLNNSHDHIKPPEITPSSFNYVTKSISNKFKLQNRHHFVPKGMSPIFEKCQSKNICSYNLEMDYFKDDLYHNFANNVLDNFKTFEKGITNVNDISLEKLNKDNNSLIFSAQSLRKAKVFGQVDKKFILAELHSDSLNTKHLVLFDQHAVHERIRLENNLSDYKNGKQWRSVNCEQLCMKLPKDIILYMNNFKEKIEQFGLRWRIDNECIVTVSAVPKALFGKHYREPDIVLSAIKSLILEEIKAIKSLGGNILLYPKAIMDLVFSEACRYAIKFGDKLSKTECATLISSLSNCKTPFQCAHGRPVIAVLLDLKYTSNDYKVNKSKILMFQNKTMS